MARTVFFSWQADTPNKVGRNFLKEVLDEVCVNLASDINTDEAMREIEVDSDTRGVAGQPPIVDTIFRKIDTAGVFVADLTFIAKRIDNRPMPNPNVLIEYGWALKSLGYERIICIMNTAYGKPTRENLPFDLGHLRFPICYYLPEDASTQIKTKEKKVLIAVLQEAICASFATMPQPISAPPLEFPAVEAKDGPARFRISGEALGYDEGIWGGEAKEVFLSPGPAMWLRIIPKTIPQKQWTLQELIDLRKNNTNYFQPLIPGSGWNPFHAEDGVGVYRAETPNTQSKIISTNSITFIFETGEIWAIEKDFIVSPESKYIYQVELEKIFTRGLEKCTKLFETLGIDLPYKWEAGIYGLKGKYLNYPPPPGQMWIDKNGPVCTADQIDAKGEYDGKQSLASSLMPFFEKIFQKCAHTRPNYLSQ